MRIFCHSNLLAKPQIPLGPNSAETLLAQSRNGKLSEETQKFGGSSESSQHRFRFFGFFEWGRCWELFLQEHSIYRSLPTPIRKFRIIFQNFENLKTISSNGIMCYQCITIISSKEQNVDPHPADENLAVFLKHDLRE